jgi:hypothetical protein
VRSGSRHDFEPTAGKRQVGEMTQGVGLTSRVNVQRTHLAVSLVAIAIVGSAVLAGCGGSSKPSYCGDRTNLENAVKGLPSQGLTGGISGLKSQISQIQTDANAVVSSAKSDFPSQTSAITSSVNTLKTTLLNMPTSPSVAQIAGATADAAAVVSAVKTFTDATASKCS